MGAQMSYEERRNEEIKKQEEVYNKALRDYNARINAYKYNPNINMPFWKYEKMCRGQFELDILPDYVKYGSHYSGH